MSLPDAKRSFRRHVIFVGAVSATMLAVTALTSWHAYRETGNILFLNSHWEVIADVPVRIETPEDEAMADEDGVLREPQRVFMPIVGLFDATLPVIWLGGAWLGLVAIRQRRR